MSRYEMYPSPPLNTMRVHVLRRLSNTSPLVALDNFRVAGVSGSQLYLATIMYLTAPWIEIDIREDYSIKPKQKKEKEGGSPTTNVTFTLTIFQFNF